MFSKLTAKLVILLAGFLLLFFGYFYAVVSKKEVVEVPFKSTLVIPQDTLLTQGCLYEQCPVSIDDPRFIKANDATGLSPDDVVIGVRYNNETRAYPKKILSSHMVVNDIYSDVPVLVTYCPLCGTGVGYVRKIADTTYDFHVSGKVLDDDFLLLDSETMRLWFSSTGIEAFPPEEVSPQKLDAIPVTTTTWEVWYSNYPQTVVLQDPAFKEVASQELFPADLVPDSEVLGIIVSGEPRAYVLADLYSAIEKNAYFEDVWGDTIIGISKDSEGGIDFIDITKATSIPQIGTTWKIWHAFYPYTSVFQLQ